MISVCYTRVTYDYNFTSKNMTPWQPALKQIVYHKLIKRDICFWKLFTQESKTTMKQSKSFKEPKHFMTMAFICFLTDLILSSYMQYVVVFKPLYNGGLFNCYRSDKVICHFRDVRSISRFYSIFDRKSC